MKVVVSPAPSGEGRADSTPNKTGQIMRCQTPPPPEETPREAWLHIEFYPKQTGLDHKHVGSHAVMLK